MLLHEVLERLYDAEINADVSSFWDSGWRFRLGDGANGYIEDFETHDLQEGADWLLDVARQHHPEADL